MKCIIDTSWFFENVTPNLIGLLDPKKVMAFGELTKKVEILIEAIEIIRKKSD
jgi:hypothetical protein